MFSRGGGPKRLNRGGLRCGRFNLFYLCLREWAAISI